MKKFEIVVWWRFVYCGEVEKDFQCFVIDALNLQEAVNKCSEKFTSHSRIPFGYYEFEKENVKLTPQKINDSNN
jgi:hypothetical protein